MKVYALGNSGFVSQAVCDAIGAKPWQCQARVLIVATTKVVAVQVAAERQMNVGLRDAEFRQASGDDVDALAAAGFCDEPAVFALSNHGGSRFPVVRLDMNGAPEVIGTLISNYPNGYGYTFTPNV